MSTARRLERGGLIDRSRRIHFKFNGRDYSGHPGDTLASALLAQGVRLFGRSFKYHRPRGVVGAGAEEPNALVQVGEGAYRTPNLRATQVELYEGLTARTVNGWPNLAFDIGAINNRLSRLLPAGFYYKTFMWPRFAWLRYEHHIRHAAGLGHAPSLPDPDHYDKRHAHCDVFIAGAGPAGLVAALGAARAGARVMLVDEQAQLGGSLLHAPAAIGGGSGPEWVSELEAELKSCPEVTVLTRATVSGYYDHNFLVVNERRTDHVGPGQSDSRLSRERLWRVRAKQVVIATGAIERPLVFDGNDTPGVMLASAVSTYIRRYALAPGRSGAVFTNNDSGYQAALDMVSAGMDVRAVVDAREKPGASVLAAVSAHGIPVYPGSVVPAVRSGLQGLQQIELATLSPGGDDILSHKGLVDCQVLAMSGGWSPAVHLHSQSGGRPRYDEAHACFVPGPSVQAERSAGACRGSFTLSACLHEGADAGISAAAQSGWPGGYVDIPATEEIDEAPLQALWEVPAGTLSGDGVKKFLDFQNDTTAADIRLAAREGYRSIEHVKRYTALGFGTDQGKLGNINGLAILAGALGKSPGEVGTTTFRPNYTPVTFGAVAGRTLGEQFFDPVRKTAIHAWHVRRGAEFEDVGQWKRPWFYPREGEDMHAAVNRECLATRNGVGVLDASTLGKIDIRGPDAAEFLNLLYTNNWDNLQPGRCRYGFMLGEDGMVMDDGVTSCLAPGHYLMTTTTGGAAAVMAWMERWLQTEWPYLKVYLTSVTDQWSVMSVAGPDSRTVLKAAGCDLDLDTGTFPFMSMQAGQVGGIPARVSRISFSGELAFEISVDANQGLALWQAIMTAGRDYDITPYGTEAMHVLRAEKGYVIVGQDTDGSVTPVDLGMDWIVSGKKDFIGKRSLCRSDTDRPNRKQLVGLKTEDPTRVLPEGAQLVNAPQTERPVPMIGHVSSSYYSANLGRSIALALVKGGLSRMGARIFAQLMNGSVVPATICEPVFLDPENQRAKS
ncbi:MAG TPA: sarcosine oxidase subunit alpha [Gammaproteobacteria bacterium]|nr:sarcosine oxidase subunit alpha [Acidiferrobacteraceae bacterium]MDP6398332.1 sarcosine oxidase subunit alpha family protein [Arenicellales bacterium]HCX87348.1 sarcosine oxidase subunit alpha [Gammaproteobacteria bacterium]MDP6552730.1 sarcosine oxidase subunit alpha family protein [Arenicellales bacterium]MDP6791938.1 sarcosine oxidase subunit alpha family protein [Arenicellales bacterium]